MRLQSYLSQSGICSRREAARIIQDGKVKVNNIIILEPGHKVNVNDSVSFNNKLCKLKTTHKYFMMHKPRMVETTHKEFTKNELSNRSPKLRTKDIIYPYYKEHIFYIGRLDYHTSGLLLYTTDGVLANRLTHPSYCIPKVYVLHTDKEISDSLLNKWMGGIRIKGETYTLTAWKKDTHIRSRSTLTLSEGKNREIRRICEYAKIRVKSLHRISFASLNLGSLKVGELRSLTNNEIEILYKISNLIQ